MEKIELWKPPTERAGIMLIPKTDSVREDIRKPKTSTSEREKYPLKDRRGKTPHKATGHGRNTPTSTNLIPRVFGRVLA